MRKRKMYLSVEDIAELFGLSVSFAYRVVERMNADLESKNYYVILGRVPTRYVEDKIYGLEHVEQYLYEYDAGKNVYKCIWMWMMCVQFLEFQKFMHIV